MKTLLKHTSIITGLLVSGTLIAAPYVFPAKGQTPEQQKQDTYDCHQWAVQQTGFDPTAPVQQPAPAAQASAQQAPPPQKGQIVKGAAKGAAVGGVVGQIGDVDSSDALKAGVAVGAMKGAADKRKSRAAQQQAAAKQKEDAAKQQAQQQQELAAKQTEYARAQTACLEGKGYTVK